MGIAGPPGGLGSGCSAGPLGGLGSGCSAGF